MPISENFLRDLERQSLAELINRGQSGSFVYAILWGLICVVNGLQNTHPELVYGNLALLLITGAGRASLKFLTPGFIHKRHRFCNALFEFCVLSQSLQFGVLSAYIFNSAELQHLVFPILLVAAGIVGSGTASLAINKRIQLMFPFLMITPFLVSLLAHPSTQNLLLVGVCIVFISYIYSATKHIHTDYWASILNSALLSEQAIELKHLSTTDPLTKIRNRLYFDTHLDKEWRRAYRNQEPVTAMFIDLDYFKLVNDKFGHDIGDVCLQKAATLLQEYANRSGDALARYGGEEFVIFLSNTEAFQGAQIAEKIISDFRSLNISTAQGPINLRCSIGICSHVPSEAVEQSDLLIDADKALYEAKENGRDRFIIFESNTKASNTAPPSADVLQGAWPAHQRGGRI